MKDKGIGSFSEDQEKFNNNNLQHGKVLEPHKKAQSWAWKENKVKKKKTYSQIS